MSKLMKNTGVEIRESAQSNNPSSNDEAMQNTRETEIIHSDIDRHYGSTKKR